MKRLVLLFLVLFQSLFAIEQSFLEPSEAFKPKFTQHENKVVFDLKLGKDIYLYDEKIKVFISKPSRVELTKEISKPEPVPYEEWIVQFNDLNLEIPFALVQSKVDAKEYELEVQFQGCSKKGLCYAPMKEKFTFNLDGSSVAAATVAEKKN